MLTSRSQLRSVFSVSSRAHTPCCPRRAFSFSASRWAAEEDAKNTAASGDKKQLPSLPGAPPASRAHFFADKRIQAFKNPTQRSWLGGDVPFPMNPSFKPPEPASDGLKSHIYNKYMEDPKKNNVRALSEEFHLSLKRVDAILRLKGMEAAWIQGKPLQTGFQEGMEKILKTPIVSSDTRQPWLQKEYLNSDALAVQDRQQADQLEQDENRDFARQKYQRMYWESVPEDGREPVVPSSLQKAKNLATKMTQLAEQGKSDIPPPKIVPGVKAKTPRVQKLEKPGRPTVVFTDVGGKFLDANEREERLKGAQRRKMQKLKEGRA